MSIGTEIAEAIDAAVTDRVLVVGSPPPKGRDLDLLTWGQPYDDIVLWLNSAGFLRWRGSWARFDGTAPQRVDLSRADPWFPEAIRPTLLQDAEPIPGFRHLVRPGPATVLLVAARSVVTHRGGLTDKSRARVDRALEANPEAWNAAERHAPAAGLAGAVRLLRRVYEAGQPMAWPARAAGLAVLGLSGDSIRAKGRILIEARPRIPRPTIVSFSGLDGSGKSTQVDLLRETLHQLGVPSAMKWGGFATGWRLHRAAAALDRMTRWYRPRLSSARSGRRRLPESALREGGSDAFLPAAMDEPWRQQMWVGVVAVVNAIKQWTYVLEPRRGTKVVILDRFSPDAAVKLDFLYGHERRIDVSWQRSWFNLLSPKPDVGFLVAVPGEVAYARAGEWEPEQLKAMARLYEEQVDRYRLVRLDGTQPIEVLARRVAVAAWQGMR